MVRHGLALAYGCASTFSTFSFLPVHLFAAWQFTPSDSFAGGKAAWDPVCCPPPELLLCGACGNKLALLLQVLPANMRINPLGAAPRCLATNTSKMICAVSADARGVAATVRPARKSRGSVM